MQIKDFYVVPENQIDENYINEEMPFLIDVSIRNRDKFKNVEEYIRAVENHFNSWTNQNVSYG